MSTTNCPNCHMELNRQPVNTIAACPGCGQYLEQMFDGSLRIVAGPARRDYSHPAKMRSDSADTIYGVICCILITIGWCIAFFVFGIFIY